MKTLEPTVLLQSDAPTIFVADNASGTIVKHLAGLCRAKVNVVYAEDSNQLARFYADASKLKSDHAVCFVCPKGLPLPPSNPDFLVVVLSGPSLVEYLFKSDFFGRSEANGAVVRAEHDPDSALQLVCVNLKTTPELLIKSVVTHGSSTPFSNVFPQELVDVILLGIDDSGALCA
jgi:hypothetical protein